MTGASFSIGVQVKGDGTTSVPGSVSGSGLAAPRNGNAVTAQTSYTMGTGTGLVNNVVIVDLQLAASANTTLNLNDGSVVNILGEAAGFQTLRAVSCWCVANPDGTTAGSGVKLEPGASNPTQLLTGASAYLLNVKAGTSGVQLTDDVGLAVTNTTCNVKVTNLDGSNKTTVRLCLAGRAV